jgi:prepilin-type N-terminal cleavage/methylation domain-containing protein
VANNEILDAEVIGTQFRRFFHRRTGFTITEVMVALVAIAVVGVAIAQLAFFGIQELASLKAQQAANELAANILEAARTMPWERLDKEWAATQTVPADMKDLLPEGKVVVTVEEAKSTALTRRVTVEVRWQFNTELPPQSVELTTVFSGRAAKQAGGQP